GPSAVKLWNQSTCLFNPQSTCLNPIRTTPLAQSPCLLIVVAIFVVFSGPSTARATTKGLSQIVTPDLQEEGDLSLSLQIQDKRIANPYQLQAELGLTKWAEVAVFRAFQPDDWILSTEI